MDNFINSIQKIKLFFQMMNLDTDLCVINTVLNDSNLKCTYICATYIESFEQFWFILYKTGVCKECEDSDLLNLRSLMRSLEIPEPDFDDRYF